MTEDNFVGSDQLQMSDKTVPSGEHRVSSICCSSGYLIADIEEERGISDVEPNIKVGQTRSSEYLEIFIKKTVAEK